jgi:hypothetical protein
VKQSLPLRGRIRGESSGAAAAVGEDNGDRSYAWANDGAAVATGDAAAKKFHTAESMKIIDAAMEAVAAAMLASSPKDGQVSGRGGASGHHHHAHLGVGAARMIPRESSWSTVSTAGVSADHLDGLGQGTDQQLFRETADVGPVAGQRRDGSAAGGTTPTAAAAGAVAALYDDGGDDDTPTGVRAMEAGRSRFAFQQQQGSQQGRLSGGGAPRGGVVQESAPEVGRRGAVQMRTSTSTVRMPSSTVSPGAGAAAAAAGMARGNLGSRSQSFGKDAGTDGGSESQIEVDPSWWGSR